MIITFFGHRDFQKQDVYRERLFAILKSIANKGVIKINITQYLKQGQNEIIFAPLSRENKNKHIIYRVEFQQCQK